MTTRRAFMRNGAVALLTLGFAPRFLGRTVQASTQPARRRTLIAIFQRGAVDGLNMVIPCGEAAYYAERPGLAVPRPATSGGADAAINLDGFFGLHPRLSALEPLYRRGHLAVVHACGSPDPTRSHFDAQDFMESGTPGVKSTDDGWLNRLLQTTPADQATPFRAVAVSPQLPRALLGRAPALAIGPIAQFGIQGGSPGLSTAFEEAYAGDENLRLRATGREAFEGIRMLRAHVSQAYQPSPRADYPSTAFGAALREIAQVVKADVGLQVAFADVGGWDTHVNQGGSAGQLAGRFNEFARGLAALSADLDDRLGDTVILTMSEFGRTVRQNGNGGTDHGHGNAMFVIGGNVRGGRVLGRWPGLRPEQRFEGRDLAVTTDFRTVFGEIAERHLGVTDTATIFPGFRMDRRLFVGLLG